MADDIKHPDLSQLPVKEEPTEGGVVSPESTTPEQALANLEQLGISKDAALGMQKNLEEKDKYGDSPVSAFGLAALDSATFSLAGRAMKKAGLLTQEDLEGYARQNETATTLGDITGIVIPAIMTGGEAAVAKGAEKVIAKSALREAAETAARTIGAPVRAVTGVGNATEKLILGALEGATKKQAAREVLRKSFAKTAAGMVEGGGFGIGQLLREDSLGDTDLSVDNLMSAVGTGALYGGIVGGSLPLVSEGLKGAGKGVGKIFDKTLTKYADTTKALQEYLGMSPAKIAFEEGRDVSRLKYGKPKYIDGVKDWFVENVAPIMGSGKRAVIDHVETLKAGSGEGIEKTLLATDVEAAQKGLLTDTVGGLKQQAKRELHEIADSIQNKHYETIKNDRALSSVANNVRDLILDLRSKASDLSGAVGKDLVEIKRYIDKVAPEVKKLPENHPYKRAVYDARNLVKEASESYTERVDKRLLSELQKHNANYHYAIEVLPGLRKSLKDPSSMKRLEQAVSSAAAYGLLGPKGVIGLAGKELLESDFRRKLAILYGVENNNQQIYRKISGSLDNFFDKQRTAPRITATKALLLSPLANRGPNGESKSVKNKLEAINNIRDNVTEFATNPERLMDRTVKAGAFISQAAPAIAEGIGNRSISAVQFLQSKMPKRPYEATLPGMKPKPYTPSSMEVSKFERYVQAVEAPLSVLDDLESNALTNEHIEAIKTVYPRLYDHIREVAYSKMRDRAEVDMSYQKRVQLSLLLDLTGDASLLGKNIAALQQNFHVQEQADGGPAQPIVQPTQGGAEGINQAERAATDTQAFLQRKQQP